MPDPDPASRHTLGAVGDVRAVGDVSDLWTFKQSLDVLAIKLLAPTPYRLAYR
jgi:hypothetical protein